MMWGVLSALVGSLACSDDHYEGGGRRQEVPTKEESTQGPNIGPGKGTSTEAGASTLGGSGGAAGQSAAGVGGTLFPFPFPFGGAASSGAAGSGGTGG
jgi:hypothetical protein